MTGTEKNFFEILITAIKRIFDLIVQKVQSLILHKLHNIEENLDQKNTSPSQNSGESFYEDSKVAGNYTPAHFMKSAYSRQSMQAGALFTKGINYVTKRYGAYFNAIKNIRKSVTLSDDERKTEPTITLFKILDKHELSLDMRPKQIVDAWSSKFGTEPPLTDLDPQMQLFLSEIGSEMNQVASYHISLLERKLGKKGAAANPVYQLASAMVTCGMQLQVKQ